MAQYEGYFTPPRIVPGVRYKLSELTTPAENVTERMSRIAAELVTPSVGDVIRLHGMGVNLNDRS